VEDFYENNKTSEKETEEGTKRWKDLPCSWNVELILLK
jgi:hypothetical protein